MSYRDVVDDIAPKLINELRSLSSEAEIKKIALRYWEEAKSRVSEGNITRTRTALRKVVGDAFPTIVVSENPKLAKPDTHFLTDSQKGHIQRYEHYALKYISTKEAIAVEPAVEVALEAVTDPTAKHLATLETMDISQLELDASTQKIVEDAIAHSGLSLAEFIKKACQVYAKTIAGKAKQSSDNLSAVSTEELLSEKYKTHTNRAEELTRRAVYALEIHNDNCTEKSQKWHINQTAIQTLTGSKPATIKKILEVYKNRLDDHNTKHELDSYQNRKTDIKINEAIDLINLVPNGLDVM
jgi:hypothetical protein